MRFFIATATRNHRTILPRCCRSVADQGFQVRHHIQDGASEDGTQDWLADWASRNRGDYYSVEWASKRDENMYDALNGAFGAVHDEDILAWLNSDEQYLPEALTAVAEVFSENPKCDVLTGNAFVASADGRLIAARRSVALRASWVGASHLYAPTCAIFFRRRVWESGIRFDTQLRSCGDADWMVRALRAGFQTAHINKYLAVYTHSGLNLSARPESRQEEARWRAARPRRIRSARWILNGMRFADKVFKGCYRKERNVSVSIYRDADATQRTTVTADKLSWRWPK